MATANPDLVSAFRAHLLPEFGRRGACDPWWWPVGPGESLADWGLRQGEEQQLSSLRDHRDGNSYPRFLGSLGAKPGALGSCGRGPRRSNRFQWRVNGLLHIVGFGATADGDIHGFLATPCDENSSACGSDNSSIVAQAKPKVALSEKARQMLLRSGLRGR